jgi:ATP phosphoribosyltransferase regulatory subunit
MSENASPTLLPEGLRDVLPPYAEAEAVLVQRLTETFAANGYERVSPPLVEFEATLLAGMGAATADRIFRMVDPISQRTLGIRADVTAQIARLASTRLKDAARPLRLMYAGQVMRVKGHQLKPERQFTQVGFELVGPDSVAADAEAVIVAAEAVQRLGVTAISIDLALPPLVPEILSSDPSQVGDRDALFEALNHKDTAEIKRTAGGHAGALTALIEASGPISDAHDKLKSLKLPQSAEQHLNTLFATAKQVVAEAPDLSLTVDLVENRGLQYHTGVTFFLFAKGSTREIGRGGRYVIEHGEGVLEPATGATLFVDALASVAPKLKVRPCLYAPFGTSREEIAAWQEKGFRVKASLAADADGRDAAVHAGCSHILMDGDAVDLSEKG